MFVDFNSMSILKHNKASVPKFKITRMSIVYLFSLGRKDTGAVQ